MVVYLCVFKYETLWPGVADHVMLAEDCMQLCWLCVCDVGRRLHAAVLAVCVCVCVHAMSKSSTLEEAE